MTVEKLKGIVTKKPLTEFNILLITNNDNEGYLTIHRVYKTENSGVIDVVDENNSYMMVQKEDQEDQRFFWNIDI